MQVFAYVFYVLVDHEKAEVEAICVIKQYIFSVHPAIKMRDDVFAIYSYVHRIQAKPKGSRVICRKMNGAHGMKLRASISHTHRLDML